MTVAVADGIDVVVPMREPEAIVTVGRAKRASLSGGLAVGKYWSRHAGTPSME